MLTDIKNDLEYRAEYLEWENIYFRIVKLLEEKEGEEWKKEKEFVENWWVKFQEKLKELYGRQSPEKQKEN